jgi:hypothetical protein
VLVRLSTGDACAKLLRTEDLKGDPPQKTAEVPPPYSKELTMLNVGDQAPDFSLPSDSGGKVSLGDFRGKTVVLYFFPKADTPG